MEQILPWLAIMVGGLVVTVQLTIIAGTLTIVVSILVAVASISPWRLVRVVARIGVDVFRSIPLLLLLVFVYYGLGPLLVKVGLSAFSLAVIALVLNESAYLAEVYRGSLQSIPRTQWEAAYSLGLSWPLSLGVVVLPQALRPAIPSTLIQLIWVIKNTSLASLVAVKEVTLVAQGIVYDTFEPIQVYLLLGALYMALIIPLTVVASRFEGRVQRRTAY